MAIGTQWDHGQEWGYSPWCSNGGRWYLSSPGDLHSNSYDHGLNFPDSPTSVSNLYDVSQPTSPDNEGAFILKQCIASTDSLHTTKVPKTSARSNVASISELLASKLIYFSLWHSTKMYMKTTFVASNTLRNTLGSMTFSPTFFSRFIIREGKWHMSTSVIYAQGYTDSTLVLYPSLWLTAPLSPMKHLQLHWNNTLRNQRLRLMISMGTQTKNYHSVSTFIFKYLILLVLIYHCARLNLNNNLLV